MSFDKYLEENRTYFESRKIDKITEDYELELRKLRNKIYSLRQQNEKLKNEIDRLSTPKIALQ